MPAYRDAYNEYSQDSKSGQLTVGWQTYTGFKPYYKIAAGSIDQSRYITPARRYLSRTHMGFVPPPGLNPPMVSSMIPKEGVRFIKQVASIRPKEPSLSDHILPVSLIAVASFLLGRVMR